VQITTESITSSKLQRLLGRKSLPRAKYHSNSNTESRTNRQAAHQVQTTVRIYNNDISGQPYFATTQFVTTPILDSIILSQCHFATTPFRHSHNPISPRLNSSQRPFSTASFCHNPILSQRHFGTTSFCHNAISRPSQFATVTTSFRHAPISPQNNS